jgi:hypothetical protein
VLADELKPVQRPLRPGGAVAVDKDVRRARRAYPRRDQRSVEPCTTAAHLSVDIEAEDVGLGPGVATAALKLVGSPGRSLERRRW